ncbi:piRNA biogenesis protein EXD1 [Stegastes partitus]|uniref:PiRNA biogenesis protein EXD1 n=1 Tax=Stegastes partitus TaxID=144197 RepID=A0A9Y4N8Q3_9TELE|nr:PREDICTED: exonuclease 3'-5' domain-containing protein 1 [Stegastes partitus]
MVVDDLQFMSVLKGKRIKLTLKTASYFGVVQRINPNKTLVLADVSSSNGCKLPGTKIFFGHEILNGEFTCEDVRVFPQHKVEEHLKVERFQPYKKMITLDDEDEDEFIDFVVIDEFHEKFGPAVMHIKKQHVIGVAAEGVEVFKSGRLCWLQIATKNKVYLFDILLLGARAFKNGLSMILESKHILKVIHDCRAIGGCLITQFGVKLANIFDTQVADVMCFYSETGGFLPDRVSTLQAVVNLHLKVPSSQLSSLQIKSQLTKEEREMWYKRPCPVSLLKVLALSVIHLQPLRLVLLDTLMSDYMALVDSYLSSSHYEPDELEHVNMESALELPTELRQLDQMRRERREWAAGHFPVTEQGLLARFNPQPPSSSQTSPAAEDHSETQPDSLEPATVKSPSSPQMDLVVNQPPTSPSRVVDVRSSPNLPVQPLVPTTLQDLQKPKCASEDRGCTKALMDMMGIGRPFGKESCSPTLPALGRGFLLQIPSGSVEHRDLEGLSQGVGHIVTFSWDRRERAEDE